MEYLQPIVVVRLLMINDMAKRQLGVERDDALNQNILELLKIEDEYELERSDYPKS